MTALLAAVLLAAAAPDAEALRHFDYPRDAPLDVQETGVARRDGVAIYDLTYASPHGGRVPAYLVVPNRKGPFAAVVWGHWYWDNSEFRNRREFLEEAVALAPAGVVSLLTDGPVARFGHVPDKDPLSDKGMAELLQQVVDLRRGADLLLARKDVDPQRLAFVGHSYNATAGAILSGVDKRFAAFVLMAGTLSDEVDSKTKLYEEFRQTLGPEKYDAFAKRYAWLDPGRYVAHAAPAAVLLQYSTQERWLTVEWARKYAEVVSRPREFKTYAAPHALNAEARRDRVAFLARLLKLTPPSAAALAAVPDLPQPPEPEP